MTLLPLLLFLAAIILFVLACFQRTASAPLVPAGLACLSAALLFGSGAL